MSFCGKNITCNPYYIFEKLQRVENNYQIVWCCNDRNTRKAVEAQNVRFVSYRSFAYRIALATSKVVINNSGMPSDLLRPKKQVYIETWHGGGAYKTSGIAEKGSINREKVIKMFDSRTKYFISSCRKFSEVMADSLFISKDKFLNIGMPRNDIFFDKQLMSQTNLKVRNFYEFSSDDFIVLFAPTYRGESFGKPYFENSLNTELLRKTVEEKFARKVTVAFRGHYYFNKSDESDFDVNFSDYSNMQELLCAADMLVTDYSSSMWDFSFTGKPCLLFAPDIEQYIAERGFYTEPETWGFPIARTNEELTQKIILFDLEDYRKKMEQHHAALGSFENGTATKKVVEIIRKEMEK